MKTLTKLIAVACIALLPTWSQAETYIVSRDGSYLTFIHNGERFEVLAEDEASVEFLETYATEIEVESSHDYARTVKIKFAVGQDENGNPIYRTMDGGVFGITKVQALVTVDPSRDFTTEPWTWEEVKCALAKDCQFGWAEWTLLHAEIDANIPWPGGGIKIGYNFTNPIRDSKWIIGDAYDYLNGCQMPSGMDVTLRPDPADPHYDKKANRPILLIDDDLAKKAEGMPSIIQAIHKRFSEKFQFNLAMNDNNFSLAHAVEDVLTYAGGSSTELKSHISLDFGGSCAEHFDLADSSSIAAWNELSTQADPFRNHLQNLALNDFYSFTSTMARSYVEVWGMVMGGGAGLAFDVLLTIHDVNEDGMVGLMNMLPHCPAAVGKTSKVVFNVSGTSEELFFGPLTRGALRDAIPNKVVTKLDDIKGFMKQMTDCSEDARPLIARMLFCFPEGTLIHTPNGLVPIETIRGFDAIYSYDEVTGNIHEDTVLTAMKTLSTDVYNLTFESDNGVIEEIRVTGGHPFLSSKGYWVEAGDLAPEDQVVLGNGQLATLSATAPINEETLVYSLDVIAYNTYIVGQLGLVVHNKCLAEAVEDGTAGLKQIVRDWKAAHPGKDGYHFLLDAYRKDPDLVKELVKPYKGNRKMKAILAETYVMSSHQKGLHEIFPRNLIEEILSGNKLSQKVDDVFQQEKLLQLINDARISTMEVLFTGKQAGPDFEKYPLWGFPGHTTDTIGDIKRATKYSTTFHNECTAAARDAFKYKIVNGKTIAYMDPVKLKKNYKEIFARYFNNSYIPEYVLDDGMPIGNVYKKMLDRFVEAVDNLQFTTP